MDARLVYNLAPSCVHHVTLPCLGGARLDCIYVEFSAHKNQKLLWIRAKGACGERSVIHNPPLNGDSKSRLGMLRTNYLEFRWWMCTSIAITFEFDKPALLKVICVTCDRDLKGPSLKYRKIRYALPELDVDLKSIKWKLQRNSKDIRLVGEPPIIFACPVPGNGNEFAGFHDVKTKKREDEETWCSLFS